MSECGCLASNITSCIHMSEIICGFWSHGYVLSANLQTQKRHRWKIIRIIVTNRSSLSHEDWIIKEMRREVKKKNCVAAHRHISPLYVTCNAICICFYSSWSCGPVPLSSTSSWASTTQVLLLLRQQQQQSASITHSLNGTQKQNECHWRMCARPVAIYDQMHIFVFHFFFIFLWFYFSSLFFLIKLCGRVSVSLSLSLSVCLCWSLCLCGVF